MCCRVCRDVGTVTKNHVDMIYTFHAIDGEKERMGEGVVKVRNACLRRGRMDCGGARSM